MLPAELRRRLSEIARGKQAAATTVQPESLTGYVPDFDVSGRESRNGLGAFLVSEQSLSEIYPDAGDIASAVTSAVRGLGLDPSRLLFLDLETCGLGGVPLFLIGTMRLAGADFEISQLFARDYTEEPSLLEEFRVFAARINGFVTFNGKAFDIPYVADRMRFHKMELVLPGEHFDLLHAARRMWKGTLPDCRLQTLEEFVCRRRRSDDVPGSLIPGLYHDFVRTGNFSPIIPVFRHNVMDLVTMAELLPQVVGQC